MCLRPPYLLAPDLAGTIEAWVRAHVAGLGTDGASRLLAERVPLAADGLALDQMRQVLTGAGVPASPDEVRAWVWDEAACPFILKDALAGQPSRCRRPSADGVP